jgi:tetratricopeptide (TPR) repeat protein
VTADYLATGAERSEDGPMAFLEAEVALRLDEPEVAERVYLDALAQAREPGDQLEALAGLGQLAFRGGEPRRAIDLLERALGLSTGHEADHPMLADTLGRAYAMVGELESAISIFERCLTEVERREDKLETIRFAVLLAYALIDSANFGRAEEVLGRALAVGREFRDPIIRARLFWSQSRLHAERNDAETAARYARKALEILQHTENTHYTARAHQLLAHIELDRGRAEEALELLEAGWPLLADSGNPVERAQFRLEEARALAKLGRREEAASLAMQVSARISEAHPEDAARSYAVLADVFEDLGDRARARELYELAADLLSNAPPTRYLVDVSVKLAELLETEGRRDEAFQLMKKALGMQQAAAERTLR